MVKRDNTIEGLTGWAEDPDLGTVIGGFSNVVSFAHAGKMGGSYVVLRTDGTLLGFKLHDPAGWLPTKPVIIQGQLVSNVMAITSVQESLVVLKTNGTVFKL